MGKLSHKEFLRNALAMEKLGSPNNKVLYYIVHDVSTGKVVERMWEWSNLLASISAGLKIHAS